MILSPENILLPILLIGLPLFVLAASCSSALRAVRGRSENGATVTFERLSNCAWLDIVPFGAVMGLGGFSAQVLELNGPARLERVVLYAFVAFVGVLAASAGNLKLKLAARVKHEDATDTDQEINRHTGSLAGCVDIFVFLGISGCFGGVPPLLLVELALIVFVVPLVYVNTKQRRESQLLWLLAISVRNGRNLAEEIDEQAGRHQGLQAHELRGLASNLRTGMPLGKALSISGSNVWWVDVVSVIRNSVLRVVGMAGKTAKAERTRLLPPWVIAAITTGDSTGTLRQELDHVSTQHLDSIRSLDGSMRVPGAFRYVLLYATLIPLVCGFLFSVHMPRHQRLFADFDTELPALTLSLFAISNFVSNNWPYLSILLAWPIYWLLRIGLGGQDTWRNLQQRYLMWIYRRADTPDILRRLARVVRTERPLSVGLDALAASHQRRPVREALAKIGNQVRSGTDCWAAMLEARFLSPTDVDLLAAAQRNHNLAWALDELAATRDRRLAYRLQVVMQIVHPCLVMAVGVVVGFVVIAYFLPLVKLLNDLS